VAASAGRAFGESQANRLPESEREWRKFDVIIVGDVAAEVMDEAAWGMVSRCVNERGALLVLVAGPRNLPHGIDAAVGRALVPVEVDYGRRVAVSGGEEAFRFGLTAAGRGHPVVRQSGGQAENEALWAGFPELGWRYPVRGLKAGAEVLLTAADAGGAEKIGDGEGLEQALGALAKRDERDVAGALLVVRQTGKGKVVMLLTDRTWRLREGAGDLYHHRFWGSLVRGGAGPAMRAGGERVRLGTDQLTYTPDDDLRVIARLRDAEMNPVADASLRAEILRDGEVVSTVPLVPVAGSDGLYEVKAGRLEQAGRYQVRLRGERAEALAREDGMGAVAVGIRVVGSRGPVELAETTLNLPLLETIAGLSGGKVVDAGGVASLIPLFVTEEDERMEVRETRLWDQPWVLLLLVVPLAAEWILRRAGGLP
jgi:hypothetical protein